MRLSSVFNQTLYALECSELEENDLMVLSFGGSEKISDCFRYDFELLSYKADLDPELIVNKRAVFRMNLEEDESAEIHGIISEFQQLGRTPDYVSYRATLVPRFWWTVLNRQSQIFQNMTIDDIISQVLTDGNFSGSDFEFTLDESYPELEYVTQYNETDFAFINRWLEHYGIYYYFDHSDGNDKIIFSDVNDTFPDIDGNTALRYNQNRDPLGTEEGITEITSTLRSVTGGARVKDYNYKFPNKQLLSESQLHADMPGTYYDYGSKFLDESGGDLLARVRNEESLASSNIFQGRSDCQRFHAGHKFEMTEHYREDWNGEYILTEVSHTGSQSGLFGLLGNSSDNLPTYENSFRAIPSDVVFRPERLVPWPKIYGTINAVIDASGDGEYAEINDQGEYKVILPFDLSGKDNGEASKYIRMAQPYAGPGYGMHFPLHKGAEVLLSFIDGNPDKPIISGTVPNPANASPVTNSNQTQSVIRTAGDNEVIIEDVDGGQQIRIRQACGNEVLMDGNSGNEFIHLTDPSGNKIKLDANAESIIATDHGGNQILMDGKGGQEGITIQDKFGNQIKLDAVEGILRLFSPSHTSEMVLGRSVTYRTDSDEEKLISGELKATVFGSVNEAHMGNKSTFVGGWNHETIIGLNTTVSAAKQFESNMVSNERKARSHIKFDSEKHIHLIGGAGDDAQLKLRKDYVLLGAKGEGMVRIKPNEVLINCSSSGDIVLKTRGKITLKANQVDFSAKTIDFKNADLKGKNFQQT
jgi:type VI secretion system secreted protein VgrG